MPVGSEVLEIEAKRRILDDLLGSSAFGRSDQLRQMLRYIVEEELAGRGDQLSEYAIGVHALGRPAGYSPEVDSTVRTRAHELRRRMEDHFQSAEGWRIELPKGSYRARFVPVPIEVAVTVDQEPERKVSRFWPGFATGVFALLALGLAAKYLWPLPEGERAAREIWGPLLAPGGTVTVLLATTPQLWVREFGNQPLPEKDPPFSLPVPSDPRFADWYRQQTSRVPQHLILHPNIHSPLGGEAEAAVRLAAFLSGRGVQIETLVSDRTGAADIRDRNAVVLGRPEYSRVAATLQPADGFAVRYVPERREFGVVSADGQRAFFRDRPGNINYGLITVLTKRTDAGPHRTILFAGINSDGSDAAMEHLTSLLNLTSLAKELRTRQSTLPDSYQVVVRARSSDTRILEAERVAVHVLGK
ncbi:MAG: hypothetical protein K2X03_07010 [Bryobacteraceae bacterium]|nr:hypothetical protein [Bryobacteraceae bacterium]